MTLICTACSKEILQGEKYVTVTRALEKFKRNAATVVHSELVAVWHESCAPRRGSALLPI